MGARGSGAQGPRRPGLDGPSEPRRRPRAVPFGPRRALEPGKEAWALRRRAPCPRPYLPPRTGTLLRPRSVRPPHATSVGPTPTPSPRRPSPPPCPPLQLRGPEEPLHFRYPPRGPGPLSATHRPTPAFAGPRPQGYLFPSSRFLARPLVRHTLSLSLPRGPSPLVLLFLSTVCMCLSSPFTRTLSTTPFASGPRTTRIAPNPLPGTTHVFLHCYSGGIYPPLSFPPETPLTSSIGPTPPPHMSSFRKLGKTPHIYIILLPKASPLSTDLKLHDSHPCPTFSGSLYTP